jgi:energy-coupling factor transport system permease protein
MRADTNHLNARAVAAWSAACLVIVLATTNPAYKTLVLAAALAALVAGAGFRRIRRLVIAAGLVAAFAIVLNLVSAHLGDTILFTLPEQLPGIGGPYTLEALAYGATGGVTVAAAIFAAAPFSLLLASHEVMDALPAALSRTGAALAAALNLVPAVGATFVQVSEAQRMRGWRPRGPRSWAEVAVPVVLTSVESSIQLAESMEARGFGSGPRTHMSPVRMNPRDWVLVVASASAVALFVISIAAGWAMPWAAYPLLTAPPVDPRPLLACLLLFTPALQWRSRT